MVVARIEDGARYYALHPLLKPLFEYVKANNLLTAPAGRITLQGDDLFINVNDSTLVSRGEQKLEVHRRYIDVHFPLSCAEDFGWRHLSTLGESDAPFDEANDYALYTAPADKWFTLCPGEFCIVWPEDAHAPVVRPDGAVGSVIRKLVAKLRI
ncbi:MAG: YhcH/YjgK/YiaL family protein [Bacteroidaceae bacterium]|nr:YhcH/YjgK/YiaL family protein [Bacteroidaceae bacterium]